MNSFKWINCVFPISYHLYWDFPGIFYESWKRPVNTLSSNSGFVALSISALVISGSCVCPPPFLFLYLPGIFHLSCSSRVPFFPPLVFFVIFSDVTRTKGAYSHLLLVGSGFILSSCAQRCWGSEMAFSLKISEQIIRACSAFALNSHPVGMQWETGQWSKGGSLTPYSLESRKTILSLCTQGRMPGLIGSYSSPLGCKFSLSKSPKHPAFLLPSTNGQ